MRNLSLPALGLALLISGAFAANGFAADRGSEQSEDFLLQHVEAATAATALRSIASTKNLEFFGDRGVRVSGDPEMLQMVQEILRMIDFPPSSEVGVASYNLPSGDASIVRVQLKHSTMREVMMALRNVLAIKKVAGSSEPAFVLLRDTPERVRAAQELIRILEKPCSSSG